MGFFLDGVRLGLAVAFALQLPAEMVEPLVRLGPISITNLELTGYLLVASWTMSVIGRRVRVPKVPRAALVGLAIFVGGALLATAAALVDPVTSGKVLMRLLVAGLIGLAVVSHIDSRPADARVIGVALLTGGVVSAVLGLVEAVSGWTALGGLLSLFRDDPVTLGGFTVRATGTLLHPNLAGFYWGTLAVASAVVASRAGARVRLVLLFSAVILMIAVAFTYSRGALLGTTAATIAGLWILSKVRVPLRTVALVALPLPVALVIATAASPLFITRMTSQTDIEWYRFSIDAPRSVEISQRIQEIPVTVTNESPLTWPATGSGAVAVSYHLLDEDGSYIKWEGLRTPLPYPLEAGRAVTVMARVAAPASADEVSIQWDLLQVGRTWFSRRSTEPPPITNAAVSSSVARPPDGSTPTAPGRDAAPTEQDLEVAESQTFSRTRLWQIALEMIVARPLTGVGLDNYRLSYGAWVGLRSWDKSINTNSLYLELLVSAGIASFGLLAAYAAAIVRGYRRALRSPVLMPAFAWLVLVALAVHGVFDAFITMSSGMYLAAGSLVAVLTADAAAPSRSREKSGVNAGT